MLAAIARRWKWLGLGGALVSLALALYLTQAGRTAPATPDDPQPQVPGRLMYLYFGETRESSLTGFCEYDAWVRLSGDDVVLEVQEQGERPPVKVGDAVAGVPREPPRPGVPTGGGDPWGEIHVYWGADGKLHAGCAPESLIIYDNGEQ